MQAAFYYLDMKWIEFAVYTTDMGVELVCGALAGVGLEQVAIEESEATVAAYLKETAPYWDYADATALAGKQGPCVKAYIADLPEQEPQLLAAREAVARLYEIAPEVGASIRVLETRVDDQDWANSWKQYYKPIVIGEKLLVCPSWEEVGLTRQQKSGRALIRLDPGMVFGTGAHHTTRLCLEALERYTQAGMQVLDIGCGSGILSVAALKLGAANAVCVDIDPVAERVVRDNVAMNELEAERCKLHIGDILKNAALRQAVAGQYDIVVANIVADVVIALCPLVPAWIKPGGLFLCSGIIDEREQDVHAALLAAGFLHIEVMRSEEQEPQRTFWLAFAGRAGVA